MNRTRHYRFRFWLQHLGLLRPRIVFSLNSIEWTVSFKLDFPVIVCWLPWWVLKTRNVNWLIELIDKLGQSNQNSFFQLWDKVQPLRVRPHSDAMWTMWTTPDSRRRYRTGQIWNKNMAFQQHVPFMPGQLITVDCDALSAEVMTLPATSLGAACTQTWANNT